MKILRENGAQRQVTHRLSLEQAATYAEGLPLQRCGRCGAPITWARDRKGRVAIEVVADDSGRVGLETSLLKAAGDAGPTAYTTSLPTHFAWHEPRCAGSFSGDARPRKVRP